MMEPTFENKSVCKERTTRSNDDDVEEKSSKEIITKEREGRLKQESESSQPSSPSEKTLLITKQVPTLVNTESTSMEADPRDSTSTQKDDQDDHDQMESTKAEMTEVREENERLKQLLAKLVKDYQTLQMQFYDTLQQEEKKSPDKSYTNNTRHQVNEAEMVSLSLGISSTHDEAKKSNSIANKEDTDDKSNDGLSLGLECKFEHESTETTKEPSSESNSQEKKEDEPTEVWPPSKVLKTMRSGDEEILQQSHLKKPRVCVRTRCDTPTMNDGCQWRKYGQKIAKGNPCPRAYYRCTVSPNCPVRKQVQRYAQDMSILITTYEGTHNHPLPASATAMASTTSAAASMLQSRSSSSNSEPTNLMNPTTLPAPLSMSNSNNMHGLNFTFPQTSRSSISPQFYIPNSSISTLNSHPTITLDLTLPPNNTSQYFNRFSNSSFPSSQRYSSTCLNFSSSSSLDHSNGYFSYGTSSYNSRNQFGLTNLARPTTNVQEQIYQPFMHMHNSSSTQSFTDTIAAATKVIAANPSFQSALAAALTSVVGNGGQESGQISGVGSSGLNLKLGDQSLPLNSTSTAGYTFKQNASVGCASSYNNKSTSSSLNPQQQSGFNLFPSSLPLFKSNKSASGSSDDNS